MNYKRNKDSYIIIFLRVLCPLWFKILDSPNKMQNMSTKPLHLQKSIKVHGSDIDVMGIVSNIVYVRWFEDLRTFFLDTYLPFQEMLKQEHSPILSHTLVEYKKPLTIFDEPVGHIWVKDLSRSRWTVSMEIVSDKGKHCLGEQKGYFFHVTRKRPVPIPEELREKYEADLKRFGDE